MMMPQSEFRLWQAEYSLEPFGERRADMRSAQIAYIVASIFNKELEVKDFLLNFDSEAEEASAEKSFLEEIKTLQTIFGGTIEKL